MTKLEQLLEEIKEHRNDMVARNYPYQQLTNLIYKWEEIISQEIHGLVGGHFLNFVKRSETSRSICP